LQHALEEVALVDPFACPPPHLRTHSRGDKIWLQDWLCRAARSMAMVLVELVCALAGAGIARERERRRGTPVLGACLWAFSGYGPC
jgi:hypothetical protein